MKKYIMLWLVLVLLSAGCSHLSVRHLPQNPLHLNQTDSISLDFWDFHYVGLRDGNGYVVEGKAFPNTRVWPGSAVWLQELSLSVYLSDENGVVLARDRASYPVQRMAPEGIGFAFALSVAAIPPEKDLFVTFGYIMSATDGEFQRPPLRSHDLSGEIDVFSAQQGPVPR